MEPQQNKKGGCLKFGLIAFGILIFLGVILNIVDDDEKDNANQEHSVISSSADVNQEDKQLKDSISQERLKEVEKEIGSMKNLFNIKYDDIEQITWIRHKNEPIYSNSKGFYTYIGVRDNGDIWERLVIRYYGEDWLFLKNIKIKSDDETYDLYALNPERDNNSSVWEWIDVSPSSNELLMIERVIASKVTKVRFEGKKYYEDWVLGNKEVKGLKDTQKYFLLLKEKQSLEKELS